jgi:hypothetical protein
VSGTPTAPLATTVFTVNVSDAVGATGTARTFQLTVNGPLTAVQSVAAITVQAGQTLAPTVPVTANGGVAPYTFALSGGTLPAGMSFNTSTGALSGTPTDLLTTTSFTVTVTDALNDTDSETFDLTVNAIQLLVNATSPATFTQNVDVAIPLNLDMANRGTDNIASLTVTITFDPARFQYVSDGSSAPGWSVTANTDNAGTGTIVLAGFRTTGETTNFTFHNITLKPLATGGGATVTATVSAAGNQAGGNIVVAVRNLTATINP